MTTPGFEGLAARLRSAAAGLQNPAPVLKLIGLLGVRAVQRNFRAQEDHSGNRWPRVKRGADATPLVDKIGRMPKGTTSRVNESSVDIGAGSATAAYNAIHNYGGQAGRGHKTTIPQREYMYIGKADRNEIVAEVRRFVSAKLGAR